MPNYEESANRRRDEFYAALNRERAEREASQRAFEERMNRISGEWGRFNNDEGGMVEYEGLTAVRKLPEIGGMPIHAFSRSFSIGKKRREYDGVLHCPNAMVLLEFKRRVTSEHVRKFLDEQLPEFIREFSPISNGRALYGAVVGATIDKGARELAEENGLFAIRVPANRDAEVLNTAQAHPLKAGNGKAS